MMSQDEAIAQLDSYTQTDPEVMLTIKNFHMQEVEIEEKPEKREDDWQQKMNKEELEEIK